MGIALVGLDGDARDVVLDANASFARLLGCPLDALLGTRALSERVDPAHAPAVARALELLSLPGAAPSHRSDYRFVRADGGRVWLDLSASLVHDASGRPSHGLLHALDATERKAAEERLRSFAAAIV